MSPTLPLILLSTLIIICLYFPIMKFLKKLPFKNTRGDDDLIKILKDIDPDSTRMTEWIWATRSKHGLSTRGAHHVIHASVDVTLEEIVKNFSKYFTAHYISENLFRAIRFTHDEKGCVDLYIVIIYRESHDCEITILGDHQKVKELHDAIKDKYRRPKTITITNLIGFSQNGPITKQSEVQEDEANLALDVFYPWMEESIEEFAKKFAASKDNVLVLIGPPGTGKTTFIRTLQFLLKRENNGVVDQGNLQITPELGPWVRSYEKDATVTFEDCDILVKRREDENHQMAMLLNHSAGIVANNTKLIFSTNLPSTNKIDKALLRPGRTYAVLKFRELTAEEARNVRTATGMAPIEFDDDRVYTLAEALSHKSMLELEDRRSHQMGFTS